MPIGYLHSPTKLLDYTIQKGLNMNYKITIIGPRGTRETYLMTPAEVAARCSADMETFCFNAFHPACPILFIEETTEQHATREQVTCGGIFSCE